MQEITDSVPAVESTTEVTISDTPKVARYAPRAMPRYWKTKSELETGVILEAYDTFKFFVSQEAFAKFVAIAFSRVKYEREDFGRVIRFGDCRAWLAPCLGDISFFAHRSGKTNMLERRIVDTLTIDCFTNGTRRVRWGECQPSSGAETTCFIDGYPFDYTEIQFKKEHPTEHYIYDIKWKIYLQIMG